MEADKDKDGNDDASLQLHRRAGVGLAISLVVLPVLYRLGSSSILILVFAVALNAIPEARQLFDAFLGKTPTGRSRLALIDSSLDKKSSAVADKDSIEQVAFANDKLVQLQVGETLHPPLARLVDLVQRDFIGYWYDSSVALSSNTAFPKHTRSMLNCIINNLVERVRRQDPKEVSIYLFHSLSNALITQLKTDEQEISAEQIRQEKDALIRKVRQTSEELMLTLAPRTATASPIMLSLLTEVVSLQIWSTIQSFNSDYINTSIVANFGEAVSLAKQAQKEARAAELAGSVQPVPSVGSTVSNRESIPTTTSAVDTAEALLDVRPDAAQEAKLPPPLPARTIRLDDPENPIAPSNLPGMVPIWTSDYIKRGPEGEAASSSSPSTAGPAARLASPTTSAPNSPRSPQRKRLEDQTLEEAIDQGAQRLRAFGKNLVSAGHRFLDAAVPLDEPSSAGSNTDHSMAANTRFKTLPVSRSGTGGITGAGPSRKGKERERDPADARSVGTGGGGSSGQGSPTTSVRSSVDLGRTGRVDAPGQGTSSSRPTSIVGRSGAMSTSSSSTGSFFSSFGPGSVPVPAAQAPPTPLPPSARIKRVLASFDAGSSQEQHAKLIKSLEISLFSKDLSLLFPEEAPDEQLKAVLARHTASDEAVDPSLVELSDAFHAFLEQDAKTQETSDLLMRMWTLLDHFGYMVDITNPPEKQLKEDAVQLLKKVVDQSAALEPVFKHEAAAAGARENSEDLEKSFWTAIEMSVLRLEQNPNREIFDPLKDWLLRFISETYWHSFLQAQARQAGGLPVASPPRMTRIPSASTSRRTLDNIAGSVDTPRAEVVEDAFDLSDGLRMRMEEEPAAGPAPPAPLASSNMTPQSSSGGVPSIPPALPARQPASTAVVSAMTLPEAGPDAEAAPAAAPAFTITLTDLSPPSAYQNNHVKNKKELEFMIAVEAENAPGYILTRHYPEFEKMDQGIKKVLPQSGTKTFPRAPLPSTNFQTSDNLCRSLETYLEALLRDQRYATCDPVVRFFAKERTDSKGGQAHPLAFLGQGVNNIGKGINEVGKGIGKSGEFAGKSIATGFNQFTGVITSFPTLKRSSSGQLEGLPATPSKGDRRSMTTDATPMSPEPRESIDSLSPAGLEKDSSRLKSASRTSLASSTIASVKEEPESAAPEPSALTATTKEGYVQPGQPRDHENKEIQEDQPIGQAPPLPSRPDSPVGYVVQDAYEQSEATRPPVNRDATAGDRAPRRKDVEELDVAPAAPPGFNYTPRKKKAATPSAGPSRQASPTASTLALPIPPELAVNGGMSRSSSAGGQMSFEELLEKDRELQRKMAEKEREKDLAAEAATPPSNLTVPVAQSKTGSTPTRSGTTSPRPAVKDLSAVEFSSIVSFAMAILEEAYELSDSTWNLRRGILRVLETVLRTSYAGVIKAAVGKVVQSASEEAFYAEHIDKLRASFWPPPEDVWWSSVEGCSIGPERGASEKEAARLEARRLLQLQAPEGLKVALGPTATSVALARMHDCLQGRGAEVVVSSLMLDYLRLLLL